MTYVLQVIALGLASHKHRYAQTTASGKSSIMNLQLVHIHSYMAKVHMNMHAGFCVCSCFAFTLSSFLPYKHPLDVQSTFVPFPQDGWTAVLLAARCGHKEVVQELCETFGAVFLHKNKVRAMQTMSGSEWLSEM